MAQKLTELPNGVLYPNGARAPFRGPCRLCDQEADLCRSHIIPEFLYKPFDKSQGSTRISPGSEHRPQFVQTGSWQRMLCASCESRLSRYERYFRTVWYGPKALRPKIPPAEVAWIFGLDYHSIRMFMLSVLWRVSASCLPEHRSVCLGAHEELVRQILLRDTPIPEWKYPVMGSFLVSDEIEILDGLIISPVSYRVFGQRCFVLTFGGCSWWYFVAARSLPDYRSFAVRTNGAMPLTTVRLSDFPPYSAFGSVHRAVLLDKKGPWLPKSMK